MTFQDKLNNAVSKNNSLLCVGLDPDPEKMPKHLDGDYTRLFEFNKAIIDATADLVCCYKPNSAFYEAGGAKTIEQLNATIQYIKATYPEIPVLLDAKRGDIGNTNKQYASFSFDYCQADAMTIQPYQGVKAVEPFFTNPNKGVFVLAKTSNPDSSLFQNIETDNSPLYLKVIQGFLKEYGGKNNCFFVAGATYPKEMAEIRKIVGDAPLLVPGIGAQGGDVESMVSAGLNQGSAGLIINSSRGVLYAGAGEDFANKSREAAISLRDEINKYR